LAVKVAPLTVAHNLQRISPLDELMLCRVILKSSKQEQILNSNSGKERCITLIQLQAVQIQILKPEENFVFGPT